MPTLAKVVLALLSLAPLVALCWVLESDYRTNKLISIIQRYKAWRSWRR